MRVCSISWSIDSSTLRLKLRRVSLTTGAREMILPGGMASSFQVLVQKRS